MNFKKEHIQSIKYINVRQEDGSYISDEWVVINIEDDNGTRGTTVHISKIQGDNVDRKFNAATYWLEDGNTISSADPQPE
jgi:pSer/pThr/pTyr-binding forkhead associated (FHA) protein